MEMKVPRGVGLIEALLAMEGKTAWIIDVWNCHGVLKQQVWGVGYGCEPDLPAESGLTWLDLGWFTIPIQKDEFNFWQDEALQKKVEAQLFRIIDRYGMINRSGWYPVYSADLEALQKILQRYLRKVQAGGEAYPT